MITFKQKIKHLYWRAGFGLSTNEWERIKNEPLSKLIDDLFSQANQLKNKDISLPNINKKLYILRPGSRKKLDKTRQRDTRRTNSSHLIDVNEKWMDRMSSVSESPFLEQMCLFWHGHFACITKESFLAQQQLQTIRKHALGNFRDFVIAIAKDPAMIYFLNNNLNKKNHPNENFARELLELFTIGIGHYSEKDIQEAARAFTGWNFSNGGGFEFRERQHDKKTKSFLGENKNFSGEDIIDAILKNRQTAKFIATKVYKYFVNDIINKKHIEELSIVFYDSGYNIEKMMRSLFESDWFYDKENIGTKIKSPIQLIAGLKRTINVQFANNRNLLFLQKFLGQQLFHPPNVSGWEGGKFWINNSTLAFRMNLLSYLLHESEVRMAPKSLPESDAFAVRKDRFKKTIVNFNPLISIFGRGSNIENDLIEFLIVPNANLNFKLKKNSFSSDKEYIIFLAKSIISRPEYQLC